MEKVYIVTYYQYDNYGTRLQNYALKKVLENLNVEVETIYIKDNVHKIEEIIKNVISYFPNLCSKQKIWKNNRMKKQIFKSFNSKLNFHEFKFNRLKTIDKVNNKFIVGSDQVWSPKHLENVKNAKELYFLKFVENGLCFSYAPSFGTNTIPNNMEIEYKNGLEKFSLLSVREEAGKNILKKLGYNTVEIMPDPVFVLDKSNWENLINDVNIGINKKYVLTYFLGKIDANRNEEITQFAKSNNYEIVNICGNYYNNHDFFASPEEFLKLIACSEVVFTDSFHASAFSIIFNKQFYVVKRNDVNQFSRLETLLSKYNLKDQIVSEYSLLKNIQLNDINEEKIINKLQIEKNIGLKYLKKIINYEEESRKEI